MAFQYYMNWTLLCKDNISIYLIIDGHLGDLESIIEKDRHGGNTLVSMAPPGLTEVFTYYIDFGGENGYILITLKSRFHLW